MNYEEYVNCQIVIHGQIEKPAHYHLSERKAIDYLFQEVPFDVSILDVGCGSGMGMEYLRSQGYLDVSGIELHPEKAKIAGAIHGDVSLYDFQREYDLIYSSHSMEHMFDPSLALEQMKKITYGFIFIIPYVDLGDINAHRASIELGTRIDDGGETVIEWFGDRGLILIERKFSDVREPEIWLRFAV